MKQPLLWTSWWYTWQFVCGSLLSQCANTPQHSGVAKANSHNAIRYFFRVSLSYAKLAVSLCNPPNKCVVDMLTTVGRRQSLSLKICLGFSPAVCMNWSYLPSGRLTITRQLQHVGNRRISTFHVFHLVVVHTYLDFREFSVSQKHLPHLLGEINK